MTDQVQLDRTTSSAERYATGVPEKQPSRRYEWAGLVYVAAWVTGLALAPSGPGAFDSPADVHQYFVDHRSVALVQSLLVHGVAGLSLILFAFALGRRLGRDAIGGIDRAVVGSAAAATLVSFVQVGLMVALYAHVGGHGSATGSRSLFNAINKADTLKLVLLAALVGTASLTAVRVRTLPRWVTWLGAALVPLLAVGGLAFLFDEAALEVALLNSLPLLLVWVAATTVTLLRSPARRPATSS